MLQTSLENERYFIDTKTAGEIYIIIQVYDFEKGKRDANPALRMNTADRDYVKSKYKLEKLKNIEDLVAEAVAVNIPL